MEYFFADPDRIKHLIGTRRLWLFLDYDGTLSPITSRPDQAMMSMETKELLKALTKCTRSALTIVTGRALPDIKKLVGLKSASYVGNHGLEIEGPDFRFNFPLPKNYRNDLKQLIAILQNAFGQIEGIIIEDKKYSLSFHYRLVDPDQVNSVKGEFEKLLSDYVLQKRVGLCYGKMVIDIRPYDQWDKGKAILWLLKKKQALRNQEILPVCIGDDVTDEDAFNVLKDIGLTIAIGQNKNSHAQYNLNDVSEVVEFLRQVLELELNLEPR